MSDSPYFTKQDASIYKDMGRYYLDMLLKERVNREDPKNYERAHQAYLHMCDLVQFWQRYPTEGDIIQLKKPHNHPIQ